MKRFSSSTWVSAWVLVSALVSTGCGVTEELADTQGPDALGESNQALYVDLGKITGSPAVTGSTYGAANEFNPPTACSDGSPGGPDLSFKWTSPQDNEYTFSTLGSAMDSILHVYVFNATTATSLLACNNDIDFSTGVLTSSVKLTLNEGAQIRIVVDSYEAVSARSSFKLSIEPKWPICRFPQNGCVQSPGKWDGTNCDYPPLAAGTACSDDNACTSGDVCNGAKACVAQPVSCDSAPKPPQVASLSCSGADGSCSVIQSCSTGYANCDGSAANGCEVNLRTSSNNCGGCGVVCSDTQRCDAGTCVTRCAICPGSGVNCCAPNFCRPKPFNPSFYTCSPGELE